jgi:hypothetical protein
MPDAGRWRGGSDSERDGRRRSDYEGRARRITGAYGVAQRQVLNR